MSHGGLKGAFRFESCMKTATTSCANKNDNYASNDIRRTTRFTPFSCYSVPAMAMEGGAVGEETRTPLLPEQSKTQNKSKTRTIAIAFGVFVFFVAVASLPQRTGTTAVKTEQGRNKASDYNTENTEKKQGRLKSAINSTVLLISLDGFRYGYQWKVPVPSLDRLRVNGTEAIPGMYSVYPTLTFPNHYSIATGLYPAWHGIVNNYFTDPITGGKFKPGVVDPYYWLGEPIWETVIKNGLVAATVFWPGSDVTKGNWTCVLPYCHSYNVSVPYEERVEAVLGYFDIPEAEQRPRLVTMYLEEPDHSGHTFGPDDPHIDDAIRFVDEVLGMVFKGLDERGLFDDINIILVSDHGMVGTCDAKSIYLEDLQPWIAIDPDWIDSIYPVLAIRPSSDYNVEEVYANISAALSSGKVPNSEFLKVYLKEDLPERLHYSDSYRIQPIIGIVAEGYKVEMSRPSMTGCGGAHGYDNALMSMRATFIAHGPRFAQGRHVQPFQNVEIYNVITEILGIDGAPNNGSSSFVETILLPLDESN